MSMNVRMWRCLKRFNTCELLTVRDQSCWFHATQLLFSNLVRCNVKCNWKFKKVRMNLFWSRWTRNKRKSFHLRILKTWIFSQEQQLWPPLNFWVIVVGCRVWRINYAWWGQLNNIYTLKIPGDANHSCSRVGPIEFHEDVLQAMATPSTSHIDPVFIKTFSESLKMLRDVVMTQVASQQPFTLSRFDRCDANGPQSIWSENWCVDSQVSGAEEETFDFA